MLESNQKDSIEAALRGAGMGCPEPDGKDFALGVLFVHGIGTQARGQTLAEWGGALFGWLEQRCAALERRSREWAKPEDVARWQRQLEASEWGAAEPPALPEPEGAADAAPGPAPCCSVALEETRFQDPSDPIAPGHSRMALRSVAADGRVTTERWLLAESWWAETFSPPPFAELVRWCLTIVPWVIGSHFAAQIKRRLAERPGPAGISNAPVSGGRQPGGRIEASGGHSRRVWALSLWLWRVAATSSWPARPRVSRAC